MSARQILRKLVRPVRRSAGTTDPPGPPNADVSSRLESTPVRFAANTARALLNAAPLSLSTHVRIRRVLRRFAPNAGYRKWVLAYDTLTADDRAAIRAHVETLPWRPLVSIVMPAYETDPDLLRAAIRSVTAQLYPDWELCVADDASPSDAVVPVLREFTDEPRIRWIRRDVNGNIAHASNSALGLATGEFVALMDHDDLLAEHALYEVVVALNARPEADLIYSDEDRIDGEGRRYQPYFKTDWNPELFLQQNLVSHLGVYRRALVEEVGGFRPGFEGSQDYDLAARVVSRTSPDKILHIPAILYHWRGQAKVLSFSEARIAQCAAVARAAKTDYLSSLGDDGVVLAHPKLMWWDRIRWPVPDPRPTVSLIVPTRDRADLLCVCLDGLLNRTSYRDVEVIVVDHASREAATHALLAEVSRDPRVRVMPYEADAFNYSDLNNRAVAAARGELVALINNDIEVVEADWLNEMVSIAVRPGIGAVGAKLVYPNRRVQHAGITLGLGGIAGHLGLGAAEHDPGYFGRLELISEVAAVTAACLLVRRSVYRDAGGLNADDLPVAFNDVDLCLRLRRVDYRNIWTPFARLLHHESASRGADTTPDKAARLERETAYMRRTWGEELNRDPFYNPNLALVVPGFELAMPPRRPRPR